MNLVTGNDLKTGAVTWWTGSGWSIHIEEAVDAGEAGDAIIAAEQAARRVNAAYLVPAERGPDGTPRPTHIKERMRALGPTVRPDLTLKPDDADAIRNVV